ncbi:hypothetical protein [Miniphocaeibacter massiliensis]|uniref:hypothetical protein n=1 Tax=Miniphocaeibacter massiliensis TaxID=2041841 RepID=UPI000C1BCBF2|nr:hypothetical protein [Miniphocaeibacter massiliensis]
MKKKFKGILMMVLLTGVLFSFVGCGKSEPEKYTLKVVNETDTSFKNIGLSNGEFESVVGIADKDIEKGGEVFFLNEGIKENETFMVEALGKDGKVYEGNVTLKGKNLVVKGVKGNMLSTDSYTDKKLDVDFDIANTVKNWNYEVNDKMVVSKYTSDKPHSTSVIGDGGKVGYSDITEANKEASSDWESGKINYVLIDVILK